ncbi:questin oxidase family protein [Streptomyces sp. 891-h]|uniref:questin oxidase family protein n=1 Tax=Streptomyces sp. 891-h TaxID=2720714 RepID=UPI001FAA90CF|nr:questin oxidase family protein [Streptomyces sp. 891-h]
MTAAMENLLAAYERLNHIGPEFGGDEEGNNGLTNHGPMVAEVMARRGLDVNIERWLDDYVPRLTDLPTPSERITVAHWREALGDARRIADWTAFFRAEVRRRPWQDTLATWWSRLLPGIAAGSTHGVIRVGHAVRTLRTGVGGPALDELANGLAFWAARWRPMPADISGSSAPGPAAALDALPELPDRSGLIAQRLTRLTRMPQWPAALAALPAPDDADGVPAALAALVDAATVRYLRIGSHAPVLLAHTATAPNAVLACLPVLPAEMWRASLAAAWAATAAITITYAGAPGDRSAALLDADNPATILLERAADHRDEHVIKFADTAVESFERTGNREALAAAHLAADLIDASR